MTVSIEPLHCGTLTAANSMFEVDGGDDPVLLPVPSWLIRHPGGVVLFDTGMHQELTAPGPLLDMASLFFDVGIDSDSLVRARLAERQVDAADVDIVVLSHLHFDHAGGLSQLPNARVLVQEAEWAAGFDDELTATNSYIKGDYDLGHDVVKVNGEHDIFGDGALTCLPTPGHTPGHQSLQVQLANETIVLCGDCAYFDRTLRGGALPPIGHDLDQQRESIGRLVGLGEAGARLIAGHDAEGFAALPAKLT